MSRFAAVSFGALALVLGGTALAPDAGAVPAFYLTTGQTGAQTQIDVNHSTTWSFNSTVSYLLGGGDFTMKDGAHTTANVTLSLYQGTDSNGTLLSQVNYTDAQFCSAHGGGCSSLQSTPFHFGTSYTILANTDYFVALTSLANDAQDEAYFIKGVQSSTVTDGTTTITQTLATNDAPEPTSLAILGSCLTAMGLLRRRRRA